jgi:hypothetical protein
MKISAFCALDAFAGGFVIQGMVAYWFHVKFGIEAGTLGSIFFGANILAGVSALLAVKIVSRIGLIKTMVFTHTPSIYSCASCRSCRILILPLHCFFSDSASRRWMCPLTSPIPWWWLQWHDHV